MRSYYLSADVYACEVSDGAIFLDLNTQKYFGVDSGCVTVLQKLVQGWPTCHLPQSAGDPPADEASQRSIVEALVERGILTSEIEAGKLVLPAPIEARDSISSAPRSEPHSPIRFRHLVFFLASYAYVAISLKTGRLKSVIHRLQSRKARLRPEQHPTIEDVRNLVAIYRLMSLWTYTRRDACLVDSLTLCKFLLHFGISPALFFGVQQQPFSAHAWVQFSHTVLNDSVENVTEHAAIAAV
jgi:hypothetical protein